MRDGVSQSPQIGSMFLTYTVSQIFVSQKPKVAIPSNRVNVSYLQEKGMSIEDLEKVAIPSNRVNVSYRELYTLRLVAVTEVAIPSNRVNVSYPLA